MLEQIEPWQSDSRGRIRSAGDIERNPRLASSLSKPPYVETSGCCRNAEIRRQIFSALLLPICALLT